MDLLDLQLDLDIEGSSTGGPPVTRRSQRAVKTTPTSTPNKTAPNSKSNTVSKTPAVATVSTPKATGTAKVTTSKNSGTSDSPSKKTLAAAPKLSTSNSTASKNSTPKSVSTPRAASVLSAPKTATAPETNSTPKGNDCTDAKPASRQAAKVSADTPTSQPAVSKTIATPKVTKLKEQSASPSLSRGNSAERTSRSDSIEKRSRNKAKKRFSPSPEIPSKKRKSIGQAARRTSSASSVQLTDAIFAEHIALLADILKTQGPSDFEIPAYILSEHNAEKDETVTDPIADDIITNCETPSETASTSTSARRKSKQGIIRGKSSTAISRNSAEKETPTLKKKQQTVKMQKSAKPTRRAVGGADEGEIPEQTSRFRTHSRELGEEVTPDEEKSAAPSTSAIPKKTKLPDANPTPRRSQRHSISTASQEDKEQEDGGKEGKEEVQDTRGKREKKEEETPKAQQRVSRRRESITITPPDAEETVKSKRSYRKKVAEEVKTEEPSEDVKNDQPTSSATPVSSKRIIKPTPNSALAIRQRLMETPDVSSSSKKPRKSLSTPGKKVPAVVSAKEPKQEIVDEEEVKAPPTEPSAAPSSSAHSNPPVTAAPTAVVSPIKFKTPSSPVRGTRTSGRVSKPNRLYVDQDYNTEVLGRDRITEQNIVIEQAQEKEPTPEPVSPVVLPHTHVATPRPQLLPKKKPVPREYVPRPIPILNGVQRGYIASVKVPLEDFEVDGVVVKLNEIVTSVMDTILLKVCGDGVQFHENIDPKVVRAKAKIKGDVTKRARIEAKKLDIQMTMKTPSTSEDLGKRKRHAPRADDYYWIPPAHKLKLNREIKEDRSSTPPEEPEEPQADKIQRKARESISHIFDAEMDATMKEAKTFSVSFEKYMEPKVAAVQQNLGINLMSKERKSSVADDFFYHELLADQHSPTKSNIENEEVDVDSVDEPEEPVTQDRVIGIRTDALDIAEQIAVLLPRPTQMDGSPTSAEDLEKKIVELPELRQNAFKTTMKIVLQQLAHESAPGARDIDEQGCNWHTATTANSQLVKDLFTQFCNERNGVVAWIHQFLVENLPIHILASYLSLLRYSKRSESSRFGYIVSSTEHMNGEWAQATHLLKSFVYKRLVEPGTEVLNNTIPYDRFSDTVFLLVPPTMTFGAANSQARPHGRLFRWLQGIGHPNSEMIGFNEDFDQSCSVAEYLSDTIIDTICDKVRQKNRDWPHCRIVLVGFGATTYLVHRAVNLVGGVSAVISIGFPVMTRFGRRGTADDEILLTYCPTLFIVGAEGQRFDNRAITALRSSMVTSTGLVIVGHANDSLLVPTSLLLRLGISQTVVYRMVLEKIMDFLMLDTVRPTDATDKSELVPIELNNIFELDSALLKSEKALSGLAFATSSTPAASPLGAAGRRATVAGGEEMPKKKRQEPSTSQQQQQQFFPAHGSVPAPSPRAEERFLAFQNLVASTVTTADDMPRRASMGSSPRVVERGDFRDRAAALAASAAASAASSSRVPPPPPPPVPIAKGPIDPASISLN